MALTSEDRQKVRELVQRLATEGGVAERTPAVRFWDRFSPQQSPARGHLAAQQAWSHPATARELN